MNGSERTPQNFITRRPLLSFFVLSYAFFWLLLSVLFVVITVLFHLELNSLPAWLSPLLVIFFSWMPNLAFVIVTGNIEGRAGIGRLFRKYRQFRIAPRWYFAAFIPFLLAFAAAGIFHLSGGVSSGGVILSLSFWVSLVVINLLEGPTGEEGGWRGFALPRLLKKYSPLKAGLFLGVIWAFWHLPLWLMSGYSGLNLLLYCLFFCIGIISLSILMTWIFCQTANSLVPMVMIHFSYNTAFALIGPHGIGLGPLLPLMEIMAALCLVTVIIVLAAGGLSLRTISAENKILA